MQSRHSQPAQQIQGRISSSTDPLYPLTGARCNSTVGIYICFGQHDILPPDKLNGKGAETTAVLQRHLIHSSAKDLDYQMQCGATGSKSRGEERASHNQYD